MRTKRILFVLLSGEMGGIEKSFLNLVKELSKNKKLNIDLFLFSHHGPLLNEYRKYVNILAEDKTLKMIAISQRKALQFGKLYSFKRLLIGFVAKYISQGLAYKILMLHFDRLENYDFAISYMHSKNKSLYGGTNEFVLDKVSGKATKLAFIHGDLVKANLFGSYNHKMYKRFDKVISVSQSCKRLLDNTWPDLTTKSDYIYNILDYQQIKKMSQDSRTLICNDKGINLLSVARLSQEKGILRVIDLLVKNPLKNSFRWYIVGDGPQTQQIANRIDQNNLQDQIILLGRKDNPYPYMKAADALFVPSYHEAAPLVFEEARYLKLPILTTETLSAQELVKDRGIGLVCANDEKSILNLLCFVVNNPSILVKIREKMKLVKSNDDNLRRFYKVVLGVTIN